MAAAANTAAENAALTWVTWAAAIFVVVAFLGIVRLLGVPSRAAEVVRQVRDAAAVLRDKALPDLDKERALRAAAGRLLALSLLLAALVGIAVGVPIGAISLLDLAGVVAMPAVLDLTLRADFLLVATGLGIAAFVLGRRARRLRRSPP